MNSYNISNILPPFLLKMVPKHPSDIVAAAEKKFGISRMTIHRYLEKLVQEGKLLKSGRTKNIYYSLVGDLNQNIQIPLVKSLNEFQLLIKYFSNFNEKLPINIYHIFEYGLTEIVNNAKDHSFGKKLSLETSCDGQLFTLSVTDDGVGVFKKLQDFLQLEDLRESILLLNKGKFTTDPTNHTGEGFFFSARSFDYFSILANGIEYFRDNIENDWSVKKSEEIKKGTQVKMQIFLNSTRDIINVFKKFQDPETLAFDRTEIMVALSKFNEERLVSRSQAVRILRNLERFKVVTLDFHKVEFVGQGFVDQVFRVFQNAHPGIEIRYINANEDVEFMIKRGFATY